VEKSARDRDSRVRDNSKPPRGIPSNALVKRNDLKYERNEIIALLAKALLEKAVSRNYVRGANS
jgi:hypothetical protein